MVNFVFSSFYHLLIPLIGQSVDLSPEAEEIAAFYAALLETDHAKDATFNKNFFEDWKTLMKRHPPVCHQ